MNSSKMTQIGASLLRKRRCNDVSGLSLFEENFTRCATRKWKGKTSTTTSNNNSQRCFLSSSRGSKHKGGSKKPRVKLSTPGYGTPEAMWCTSATRSASKSQKKPLEMGRYGLKRLDYTNMKPPVWMAPPHPPTKTTAERLVFPLSIAVVAGIILWVYMYPEEEDMTEYWKRVEKGQVLLYDDDDDDDEDEDD